jgi:geranylgeranyl diphosphate synthase, type II
LNDFNLTEFLDENKKIINLHLEKFLKEKYPAKIWEAMRYTVLADGKRIRPILAIEATKICGGNVENIIPVACAVEMLHAYSLIHDDLPCMDNDDFRRGMPTNHKVFGEAIAVLAGDALFSYAPQVIIQHTPDTVDKNILLKVLEEFFITAGPLGLIGGQVVDVESEGKDIDLSTFSYIHTHKTGELFKFSLRAGALIGGAPEKNLEALTEYGRLIGYAFQIADDILDIISTREALGKTPGKDKLAKKNTHPALYGLSQSREEVKNLCKNAQKVLKENDINSEALSGIANSIILKVKD